MNKILNILKGNRFLISIVLTSAVIGTLILSVPVSALSIDITEPSSKAMGNVIAFSTTVQIQSEELLPVQHVDLEIYKQDEPTDYNLVCTPLPLTTDTVDYDTAGGLVTVQAVTGPSWWYGYGYRNAEWQGHEYDWGYGYGYGHEGEGDSTSITYNITWNSLTSWPAGDYEIKVIVYANGDTFSQVRAEEFAVLATIDIDPKTLNENSNGKWITCYIELPDGYDVADIDAASVRLNGEVKPELNPKYGFVKSPKEYLMDHDHDGINERMLKFDRSEVASILDQGNTVEVTITGEVGDSRFEGSDTIKVIGNNQGGYHKTWKSQFMDFFNRHKNLWKKLFVWFSWLF